MDNALKLRVMFDMIDNMTKPLKNMLAGHKGLANSLKDTRRELAEMGKTQKAVASFREMRTGLDATGVQLATARGNVKKLADSLRAMGPPSQRMIADLQGAREAARAASQQHKAQTQAVNDLRTRLESAGINTRNLSQHERELRANMAATTSAMGAQAAKLEQISERERRVATARKSMQSMQGVAAGMAVGGYAAKATGTHMLGDMRESLDEAKKVQNERGRITALGLGEHATKDAEAYVRSMNARGTSIAEKMTLMRDSMSIFADEHHAQMAMPTLAKMKFANESMFGAEKGHENEEKFMNMLKVIELRGGTKDEATFKSEANMVQKVLSATGGRVGGDEWRNFIQTGKTAAKQMRQDAFFYQMEPLIQEMGGHAAGTGVSAAYSNLMQGKTTVRAAKRMVELGLVDKKMVEYTTTGTVKRIKPNALMGGDLYNQSPFEWMEKVLLPQLAKKGITDKTKILSEFATIMTNGNGANLFSTMYLQRDQIHKSERLNQGAYGIDQLEKLGAEQTEGKELQTLARLHDLKEEIGEKIIPTYNAALDKTAAITEKVIGFMKEHSTAAKAIVVTLAVLAGLLVVAGTLTIVLAGILGPMAILKFSMTTLGMQGGILARVLGMGAGAFRMLGSAFMFVGRMMLMNPIGLMITGIALAALLIYQYWEPIKGFFGGLWDGVRSTFATAAAWFGGLPAQFATFGSNIIAGLVGGITGGLGAVKDSIVGVADSTIGWFKEKLGIHSPSRVFGELGGFVSQGAAIGMENEQGRVAKAAIGLAAVAATSFASPAIAAGAQLANTAAVPLVRPTVPFDTRPPLRTAPAGGNAAGAGTAGQTIINIYPAPGDDPAAIARAVEAALDRRDRAKQSRIGSRLSD